MHCSITYFHNKILKVSLQVTKTKEEEKKRGETLTHQKEEETNNLTEDLDRHSYGFFYT